MVFFPTFVRPAKERHLPEVLLLGTHTLSTSPLCPAASTRRDSWSLYEHQKRRFAIWFWKKKKILNMNFELDSFYLSFAGLCTRQPRECRWVWCTNVSRFKLQRPCAWTGRFHERAPHSPFTTAYGCPECRLWSPTSPTTCSIEALVCGEGASKLLGSSS